MKKQITSAEIAELAGVSRATVSYILNGTAQQKRIPEKTVNRIQKIIGENQYRPNGAARAIQRKRFDCLSLLLSPGSKGLWLPLGLLRNLQREVADRGMHLNVSELPDSKLVSPEFAPKMLRELLADGLLVNYLQPVPDGLEEMLQGYSIPHIWLNDIRAQDCVYPDDFNGSVKAVKLLMEMGHRHIAYLSMGDMQHYSKAKRQQGFEEAASLTGVQTTSICTPSSAGKEAFRDRVQMLLRSPNRPTACIGYSSNELQITYSVALRQGLHLPEDLSLLSFDTHLPLLGELTQSSLVVPQNKMAKAAVEALEQKIADPSASLSPIPISYPDEAGGETCQPPLHPNR